MGFMCKGSYNQRQSTRCGGAVRLKVVITDQHRPWVVRRTSQQVKRLLREVVRENGDHHAKGGHTFEVNGVGRDSRMDGLVPS